MDEEKDQSQQQLKMQIKGKVGQGIKVFLKTSSGKWVVLIALIIIFVLFIVLMIMMFLDDATSSVGEGNVVKTYETGVTITDANGENATTVSIEDYVKGAVYAQIGDAEDNTEYIKAISVVVRTYVIETVSKGESIINDSEQNLYNPNYENNSNIKTNVNSTKGEYLSYEEQLYSVDLENIECDKMKNLALEGKTYKEILASIYGESITVDKASLTNTEGLQLSSDGKFYMRLGMPLRTNNFYYYQDSTNYGRYYEGECAAYATCRAKEILASINSTKSWNANVNGGAYCSTSDSKKFNSSTDYTAPKPGSIVSWEKPNGINGQGHVAIIEKVEGNIVTISEAFNNLGSLGNAYIRAHDTSENRKQNCLTTACFRTTTLTIEQMKNRKSDYTFMCYIYLVEE